MRISELRQIVKNDYLANDIISGKEAKELVGQIVGDKLTSYGVAQFDKLRTEFLNLFSDGGLKEYDNRVAKALAEREASRPSSSSPGSLVGIQVGRNLDHIPSSVKLSEVPDAGVKEMLERLDVNGDKTIDQKDMRKLGLSEDQLKMFLFTASLLGAKVNDGDLNVDDLRGKKICFTAVDNKEQLTVWAKSLGMTVRKNFSKSLDFLIVGNADVTSKDERAFALNGLGASDIHVATDIAFEKAARAANVPGTHPDPLSRTAFESSVHEQINNWYTEHIQRAYEDDLGAATTPEERAAVRERMADDLDGGEVGRNTDSWIIDDH
ncbi:MAG: hypothetical protein V3T05_03655, partial [Myxococcota bacterium]